MNSFNKEQLLKDLHNWNSIIKKYQIPSIKQATIQLANSFVFYVALLGLQIYLFDKSVWLSLAVAILNGFILGRIFIIQHDCGHSSFTRSRKANDIIGTLCSICTLIPYKYWAKNHSFHHAHNGQLEFSDVGDIECLTTEAYAALPLAKRIWYRIYRNPLYLFTIGGFIYVVIYNRFAFLKTDYFKQVRRNVLISNIFFIALYTLFAYLLGPGKFLVVQFVNLFFFGTYALWFFYIQHQYEHIYKSKKENWNYVVAAMRGSTYYKLPRVFHWLTGNIGYHHIHHLSPTIPNYNLARCHAENPVFEKHTNTITFLKSLKTVQANLWDAQRQKMISFSEYSANKKKHKAAAQQ
ncbi:MAG: fatty acid desaturase [Chitinophagales bacterium]|nr:fatty acid desaturase [Chitinophagales bacterium]